MKARRQMPKDAEWLARRPKPSGALIAKALEILDRPTGHAPEESDEIPTRYLSLRRKVAAKRANGCRQG